MLILLLKKFALSHDKVFVGRIEGIIKRLGMFNPLNAHGELTENEISNLSNRINKVIDGLRNVEVDYNSSAE